MTDSGADKVWVPDREEVWKVGEVIDISGDGKDLTVEIEDKVLGAYFNKQVKREDIMSYDEDHDKDFDNAFDMGDLNEAAILSLLKRRSLEDKIYTFMGNILLSVNPYKKIPKLYEPMPEPGSLHSEKKDAAPHLYVLADRVAREMFENGIRGTSQSVLINGESGAGKTVAAKQIMAFLADLSQHKRKEAEKKKGRGGYGRNRPGYGASGRGRLGGGSPRQSGRKKEQIEDSGDRKVSQIEDTILRTNPLLEAFGNARTIRNDNSSRFGKFVQLNYSQKQVIIGARTRHFLLEKSRIVKHGRGERNYHIFYQLCAAYQEDPSNRLFKYAGTVLQPNEYSYLSPSKSVKVELEEDPRRKKKKGVREGVSAMAKRAAEFLENNAADITKQDLSEFKDVTNAFHGIDVDAEEQANVYRVLALILSLGNLHFKDVKLPGEEDPQCDVIDDKNQVQKTADLLGVEKKLLLNALCKRTVRAGNRQSMTELALTSEEAVKSLDGLSKAIYEALFIWLVDKINKATGAAVQASAANDTKKKKERRTELFIGILDIFGFEILQDNSFEQLCINYANESLQGLFDDHVIKLEEAGYVEENVKIKLDYRDNKPLLNLLNEKGKGIFQLMDEQGALGPRGSDEGFLKSINNVHGSGKPRNKRFGGANFETWTFEINHFAGTVEYNVLGMVGKNADHLQPDLADFVAVGGMPVEPKELSAEEKQREEENSRMKKNRKSVASFGRAKQPVRGGNEEEEEAPVENIKETFPFLQSILKRREKGLKKQVEEKPAATAAKSKRRRGKNRKMARLVSVSKRFRDQMTELETLLNECDQHFVRCIKPNDKKRAPQESEGWDALMVSQQLKMLGALEMVRARRNGYPVRSPFENVLARYPELLKVQEIKVDGESDARKACAALLQSYYEGGKNQLWALGDTKCFMREQVSKELDAKEQKIHTERLDREERAARRKREQERLAKQQKAIVVIQRMVRGHVARQKVKQYVAAITVIQAVYRMKKLRKVHEQKRVAVVKLQALARGFLERKEFGRIKKLVPFQAHVRGVLTRHKFEKIMKVRNKYKHLLKDGEVVVLCSSLAVDSNASSRTTAGQPHVLIMTSGPDPRVIYVNDRTSKQKAELEWKFNTICSIVQNENTMIIRSEPSGPNLRKKWRFQFLLPVAIQWQLALHDAFEMSDLMELGFPDTNADVKAHGQVAPLDKSEGYLFGGPGTLGGRAQVYASGMLDLTQRLTWRHRFFVLKGTSLYWFEEDGKYAIGAITLNPLCTASVGRKVNAAFGGNMPANQGIEVTNPLLSSPLLLGCPTQKGRVDWNRHIARAIKRRREDFGRRTSVTKGVRNNKVFAVGEDSREAFDDRDFEVQIEQDEDIEQKL